MSNPEVSHMGLTIIQGDCREVLKKLPSESIQCCVSSPPYFNLRDYGHDGQIGREDSPCDYVSELVAVFQEVNRVLKRDGVVFLNLGDSYAGSGKGGNPEESTYRKQSTNHGSLSGKSTQGIGYSQRANAQTNTAKEDRRYGLKPKDLIGIPWMVAFALRADGWYLRQDIIWSKPNPMPESVTDRCTKSHEYIFMLSKSQRYFYDANAIKEPGVTFENRAHGIVRDRVFDYDSKEKILRPSSNRGSDKQRGHSRRHAGFNERWDTMDRDEQCSTMRNKRSVWDVATSPYNGAHFATFPTELITPAILAGSKTGDTILDPFGGSGTTAQVALETGRKAIIIELNPDYIALIKKRTTTTVGLHL